VNPATPFLGVSVTGLSADFGGFIRIEGNFAFEKTGAGVASQMRAVASQVTAKLTIGDDPANPTFQIGVTGGSLALILKGDGSRALDASGTLLFNAADFASVTGTVRIQMNNTGTNYSGGNGLNLNIDGISAPLESPNQTQRITITSLNATLFGQTISAAALRSNKASMLLRNASSNSAWTICSLVSPSVRKRWYLGQWMVCCW
jgi:hypothetical protein